MTTTSPALAALQKIVSLNPNLSFGKLIAAITDGHPTPYAWLGAAGDEVLALAIESVSDVPAATDDTPATEVLARLEGDVKDGPYSVGDCLQLLVSVFASKSPERMPTGNRVYLIW